MKFSLLMSIYHKEDPDNFDQCMQSVWDNQIKKPDEIILVEDGPLTQDLYNNIAKWKEKLCGHFKTVTLEQNVGLGQALQIGLKHCQNDVVARMDTDDIATADRFEKQISFLSANLDIDIVGSWVGEFEQNKAIISSYRKTPKTQQEIIYYAKKRNPMNHPSVIFRKEAVQKARGYRTMHGFEDYDLWARMLMSGARFHNLQEALVHMRVGAGQLERRSGWRYAVNEVKFQKALMKSGLIGYGLYLSNTLTRFTVRIIPKYFVRIIYNRLRK